MNELTSIAINIDVKVCNCYNELIVFNQFHNLLNISSDTGYRQNEML